VRSGEEVVKNGELRVGATNCTAGRYNTGSVDSCTLCAPGEYAAEGAGFCSTANAGEEVVKDGELRVGAARCAAGRYSMGSSDECLDCDDGTYSAAGASFCSTSGGGFFPNENRDGVLLCPAGKYSSGTFDECAQCPPGSFSFPTSASCSSCEPGHYFLDPPADQCLKVVLWDQIGDGWDNNVLQFEMQDAPLQVYSFGYPKPSPYFPGAASIERDACFQAGRCYTGKITEGPRHYQIQVRVQEPAKRSEAKRSETKRGSEARGRSEGAKRGFPLPMCPPTTR
jgi:hypothetical protein